MTEWSKAPNTMIGDWWCSVSIVRVQFSSRDTEALSSHKSNCNTVGLSFHTYIGIFVKLFKHTQYISKCRTRIRSLPTHQWLNVTNSTNKKQTKTKEKKEKERKPVDAYGGGDYISQYSSIMFPFVYSTRVCNLISTTH